MTHNFIIFFKIHSVRFGVSATIKTRQKSFVLLLASRFPRDGQYTILGSVHESGHAMFAEVVTVNDLVSTCVIKL